MFGLSMLIYSQDGYALTAQMEVIIGCEASPLVINWCRFDGEPDTQYSLTTRGIKVDGSMVNMAKWDYKNNPTNVLARCIPSFADVDMFPSTGVFPTITCPKGCGLEVAMIQPNDPNSDKYRYVSVLTITKDDKEEFNRTVGDKSVHAQVVEGLATLSIGSVF